MVKSYISDKATKNIVKEIKAKIKTMQKHPNVNNVNIYNATILGMHNYYKVATHVNIDFNKSLSYTYLNIGCKNFTYIMLFLNLQHLII